MLRPLCDAIYQVPHNCNVVQRVGKHIFSLAPNVSSNEPSNDTGILVHSKFEASALPFSEYELLSVGIGYHVLRCNKGWLAAVLGFLLQDFGRVCAALLKNDFSTSFFCMLPFNVASHLCCYFGVFAFFFSGPWRSRTSQTQPRIAESKKHLEIHQKTVFWCKLRVAQSKGLQFHQTRSFFTTLYPRCASRRW